MKLHAEASSSLNTVTGYGPDYIEINRVRHAGALLVTPDAPVAPWQIDGVQGVDGLQPSHFDGVLALAPELLIIGTGAKQQFLAPRLAAWLNQAGVGHESMDTAAACRTFNILMAEGRRVVGALFAPSAIHPGGNRNEH